MRTLLAAAVILLIAGLYSIASREPSLAEMRRQEAAVVLAGEEAMRRYERQFNH